MRFSMSATLRGISILMLLLLSFQCNKTREIYHSNEKKDQHDKSQFEHISSFGTNPGNLVMYRFVPGKIPSGRRPLVVVLHGCYGSAEQISWSGWNDLARIYGFYVLYPEQKIENHPIKCFNWFQPENSKRETGEAFSIKQMIDRMKTDYKINPSQVFVAGFSSGAFMAIVMGAAYPDIINGIACVAGGPYGCSDSSNGDEGFMSCKPEEKDHRPETWAKRVINFNNYKERLKIKWPRISIWHGMSDKIVNPNNQIEAMEQWTELHELDHTPSSKKIIGETITHSEYKKNGKSLVETYTFSEMGHTVPIKSILCGIPNEWFSEEKLCFAEEACHFFGIDTSDKKKVLRKLIPIKKAVN
jgi:poly(hydroxyalkanoate) depolymerase family esterase